MKRQENTLPAVVSLSIDDGIPALVSNAGDAARFAYDEFLIARIRNPHTRKAYRHAVHKFLSWCHQKGMDLCRIAPGDVGTYLDSLEYGPPTKKLHLSALRHFFDELVFRHVVVLNPCASVRTERYQVVEGKTPEIAVADARRLLASIDTSTVVGLRDKTIIGILIYTAARVGAVAKLGRGDFHYRTGQYCLRFFEKNGKSRQIPVRHDLEKVMLAYIAESGMAERAHKSPLFLTALGRTKKLSERAMTVNDLGRMVKRRMRDIGLSQRLSAHSFRVMTVTDLLQQGVPLDDGQSYYLPSQLYTGLLTCSSAGLQ